MPETETDYTDEHTPHPEMRACPRPDCHGWIDYHRHRNGDVVQGAAARCIDPTAGAEDVSVLTTPQINLIVSNALDPILADYEGPLVPHEAIARVLDLAQEAVVTALTRGVGSDG